MTGPFHTYGPTCLLADEEPELSSLYSRSTPPDVRSQFFYISSLPIDDPLAPLPPPTGQGNESQRLPPKPFSARDAGALESAWQEIGRARLAKATARSNQRPEPTKARPGIAVPNQRSSLEVERRRKPANQEGSSFVSSRSSNPPSLPDEHVSQNPKSRSGDAPAESYAERRRVVPSMEGGLHDENIDTTGKFRKRDRSSSLNESRAAKRRSNSPPADDGEGMQDDDAALRTNPSRDASMSGSPFIRAPISQSQSPLGRSVESLPLKDSTANEWSAEVRSSAPNRSTQKPSGLRTTVSLDEMEQEQPEESEPQEEHQSKIPVGASRLHLVELPNLQVCEVLLLSI